MFRTFRISTYSTLALACLCLGYAEGDLLPEMPIITAFVIVMIAFAYRSEGRWSLSLQSANTVGGVLAVGLICWISFQFLRPSMGLIDSLPFPANLLPYLGPVLMILVPAKLFRPKHIGDYWALQGIGLLAVTLGCAMANDLLFGALLICYVFCFAWSLALFHLYREIQPTDRCPVPANADEPARWFYLLRLAGRWSVAVMAAGTLLFLITPRPSERKWELSMFARGRMETGLSDSVDLNRVGHMEQNNEIAFTVRADDADGNPKLDLNLNQRWRASAFSHYENGRWAHERSSGLIVEDKARLRSQVGQREEEPTELRLRRKARLPDFGNTAYYLTFILQHGTVGANILADPVMWRDKNRPPIFVEGPRSGGVQQRQDGDFEWLSAPSSGRSGYSQIVWPAPEPDLGPPLHVLGGYQDFLARIGPSAMEERLHRWTWGILERLVNEGRLPAGAIGEVDPDTQCPIARNHETIARALGAFLSSSGDFAYSFDLIRKDKSIDPVEDFLYNTKAGHCERFASALVLMLRSVRVPSQLVVGFRGCELQTDGWYAIRSSQAHAWVEVLISRSPPANVIPFDRHSWIGRLVEEKRDRSQPMMQWLSIDPTPGGEAFNVNGERLTSWLESTRAWANTAFKDFVLSYDSSARKRALDLATEHMADFSESVRSRKVVWPIFASGGLAAVFAWFTIRRFRRRLRIVRDNGLTSRQAELQMPFHARLVALLAQHGFKSRKSQTILEFATDVATQLQALSATRDAADVPRQVGEAYYRVRFGDRTLGEEERRLLDAGMQQLETALINHRNGEPRA